MNLRKYISGALIMTEFELRKLKHDPSQVIIRSIQPALWLVVFGSVFSKIRGIPTEGYSYIEFMTPGVLAQSVMFVAMFYGITLVWERDLGLLNKLLSTPVPHSAIVLGKALSAGARGVFQVIPILVLAVIMRVRIYLNPLAILAVLVLILLFGICFSSISMALVSVLRTRERVMGIAQVLIMPLFFASNAIYPVAIMPGWLRAISTVNPISYVVDAMRALLVTGNFQRLAMDSTVTFLITVAMVTLASVNFRKIIA
ncbi:MAG: ABC transporter permease [Chloroflexota bacterium]